MANIYGLKTGQLKAQQSLTIEGKNSESMGSKTCEYLALAGEGMALAEQLPTPPQYASDNLSKPPKQGIRKINVTRQAGGVDLVTVSWTAKYVTEEEEDTGGGGGGDDTAMPSKSVEISTTVVEEPLMQHPKWKGRVDALSSDTLVILKAVIDGELKGANNRDNVSVLKERGCPADLLSKILKGITHYYAPRVQVTMSFDGVRTVPPVSKVTTYSGLPGLDEPEMSWLSMGGGVSTNNGKKVTKMSFMAGMWDKDIYGK